VFPQDWMCAIYECSSLYETFSEMIHRLIYLSFDEIILSKSVNSYRSDSWFGFENWIQDCFLAFWQ